MHADAFALLPAIAHLARPARPARRARRHVSRRIPTAALSQLEALKTTHEDLEDQREQTLSLRRALLDKSSADHADEARAMLERMHVIGSELTDLIDERERVSSAPTPDGGSFRDGSRSASNYGGSFRSAREESLGTGAGGRK